MTREEIEAKLRDIHGDDDEQLNFVFSKEQRILVTASAGCGKTKTMISKIAFELSTTPNLNFKKILALTFSVNASTKIKEDTKELLPNILENDNFDLDKKLDVANYHSFSTKLLFKHGYLIHENLKNVEDFTIVPDNSSILNKYVIATEKRTLTDFNEAISNVDTETVDALLEDYNGIIIDKFIPNNIITFNGLLTLGNYLLANPNIKHFYTLYYPIIIVDEFQDTNYLAYKVIQNLIDDNKKVFLIGDDIQKIYGFIGAMPNLFEDVRKRYGMTPIIFNTNYRFKNNQQMLKLDNYIRQVFRQYDSMDDFKESATINMGFYKKEIHEVNKIYDVLTEKISTGHSAAVLVNIKSSSNKIIKKLESEDTNYFNGLFNDTDLPYQKFHRIALDKFLETSGSSKSVSQRVFDKVVNEMGSGQESIVPQETMFNSLMKLLKALFSSVKASNLSRDDKYSKIVFILSNGSLKRMMNEIDEKIILTTVHSSKGLEWDYIFIPQMTKGRFPVWADGSLCKICQEDMSGIQGKTYCKFIYPNYLKSKFEEQLSLFYVAITRAKKDVYLFANIEANRGRYLKKRSCLTSLPNLLRNKNF